uniref:Uncharacterized protein n=1 Tax=viral metagenome TaxID=1070528 RepID=A0A6M3L4C0_9ZZZZ
MSHFYASIDGAAKTSGTRTGHKRSGISGHVRGWTAGVRVRGHHDEQAGHDVFCVYATSGSNGSPGDRIIAYVTSGPDGVRIEHIDA